GARRRDRADERDAQLDGEPHGALDRRALGRPDGAAVRALGDAERGDAPTIELGERGRGGLAAAPLEGGGNARRDGLRPPPGVRTSVALWPPKPNEFESAGPVPTSRGDSATTSRPMSSPS